MSAQANIAVVRKYFDACNSASPDELLATLDPVWRIDRIVAQDDEVASEWSRRWTPAGRIAEVRAYFTHSEEADTALVDFPCGERDYLR
jgi:hypothetical protein